MGLFASRQEEPVARVPATTVRQGGYTISDWQEALPEELWRKEIMWRCQHSFHGRRQWRLVCRQWYHWLPPLRDAPIDPPPWTQTVQRLVVERFPLVSRARMESLIRENSLYCKEVTYQPLYQSYTAACIDDSVDGHTNLYVTAVNDGNLLLPWICVSPEAYRLRDATLPVYLYVRKSDPRFTLCALRDPYCPRFFVTISSEYDKAFVIRGYYGPSSVPTKLFSKRYSLDSETPSGAQLRHCTLEHVLGCLWISIGSDILQNDLLLMPEFLRAGGLRGEAEGIKARWAHWASHPTDLALFWPTLDYFVKSSHRDRDRMQHCVSRNPWKEYWLPAWKK